MTDTYATTDDLTARLSSAYSVPAGVAPMLVKASETVDYNTQGRAQLFWVAVPNPQLSQSRIDEAVAAITKATCDQVEYWLEVGEEHDVAGLVGSLQGGRVQVNHLPPALGQRARRTLLAAGLLWDGAGVV